MQGMGSMTGHAPGPVPGKRVHPVVWVLICLAGLALLVILALAATGIYIASRFSEDPVGVTASVISMLDPELELVSADKETETLVLRERSTGQTITVDLKNLTSSSFHLGTGTREITIDTGRSKLTIGSAKPPDWLPAYPDARVMRSMSAKGADGLSGSQTLETQDDVTRVLDYYASELVRAGLTTTRSGTQLKARSKDGNREVSVDATTLDERSRVILSYIAKD
jgi:hypothetical protein